MEDVAVIGVGMTRFGKLLDKGIKARLADLDEFFKEFKPFHRNTGV